METPFTFGKIATNKDFANRENEIRQLIDNFSSGTNSILISPRRWGKSSLVVKAARRASEKIKKLRFCFIDLYNVRSEEQFYQLLAQEVIRASSSKWQEWIEATRNFITGFLPKITYSPEQNTEFSLELDWREVQRQPDQIIDLPEIISAAKGITMVMCIDEFQNIAEFTHPLAFQKKLRSHWQKHQAVSYCLYGSRRHMMMEVFASSSMPFYKFGELILLEKIAEYHWEKFIVKRFADTGKRISPRNAQLIAQLAELNPYYIQQLARQSWLYCAKVCHEETVRLALDNLLLQLSLLFQNLTDSLSATHVNLLHAIIEETEQLSAGETLHRYGLGTSANVLRIKKALVNKNVLDIQSGKISFLDPMYKLWLKKYYFKL